MLLLFCFVIVDPIFCDRPFILWAFFCLMTLAHIVGADVTETNKWPCMTIMLFTGDHSLGTRKTQTLFKDTNIILFLQSHLQVDSLILWFDLRDRTFFFSTFCGVFKVFITNLPSTCWLPRISGQFCDGSFSKRRKVTIWHQQKRWVFFFDLGPLLGPCASPFPRTFGLATCSPWKPTTKLSMPRSVWLLIVRLSIPCPLPLFCPIHYIGQVRLDGWSFMYWG